MAQFNDIAWRRSLIEEITLNEGVYDPGIFKAVFMAGGPGSGKGYAAKTLLGMPETMPFVSGDGLKGVNSDSAYEAYLKASGMSADMTKMSPEQFKKSQELRTKAKRVTAKKFTGYVNSKLGLLIDGTAKDFGKIQKLYVKLQQQGYDCYMVFVNTDLDVALANNMKRPRKVPVDIVKSAWQEVQGNLGKFQRLFGANSMLVVDNSKREEFAKNVKQAAAEFVKRPIKNHIAKKWIKSELEYRRKN
jgi:predicted kinase